MNKEIEIPEGYEARIEGNKVILEPKESEDERILEWIIGIVNSCKELSFDDKVKLTKYLEKQKEQKPAEWSERYIADVFEKVGLAKIVREQGNDALTNAVQSAMLELSKVGNAEWSEEDEEMILDIVAQLKAAISLTYAHDEQGKAVMEQRISWLKSLRPQPKQELSDKDKEMFDRCIANAKNHIPIPDKNGHLDEIEERVDEELVNWLKERFLNVHWKPSEEQMEALARATNRCVGVDDAKILVKLLEQLEKL